MEIGVEVEKGCGICQNRRYCSGVCERTGERVSLFSKSEWTEYLKRWKNDVRTELTNAKEMLKKNPTKKMKIEVKRLREEIEYIENLLPRSVVENCSFFKQHDAILPIHVGVKGA